MYSLAKLYLQSLEILLSTVRPIFPLIISMPSSLIQFTQYGVGVLFLRGNILYPRSSGLCSLLKICLRH